MNGLFNQFKVARDIKKVTLEDVAHKLKISQYYLKAIENSDFHLLPESVYAISFIKNYANFLGIDHTEIITCFKNERLLEKKIYTSMKKQSQVDSLSFFVSFLKFNVKINILYVAYTAIIIAVFAVMSIL